MYVLICTFYAHVRGVDLFLQAVFEGGIFSVFFVCRGIFYGQHRVITYLKTSLFCFVYGCMCVLRTAYFHVKPCCRTGRSRFNFVVYFRFSSSQSCRSPLLSCLSFLILVTESGLLYSALLYSTLLHPTPLYPTRLHFVGIRGSQWQAAM